METSQVSDCSIFWQSVNRMARAVVETERTARRSAGTPSGTGEPGMLPVV
jgi:hypothetical protein